MTVVTFPPLTPATPTPLSGPFGLKIGTVTTLSPGSNATATLTGSYGNQTLSLGIPRGASTTGVDSVLGLTGAVLSADLWAALIAALPTSDPHSPGLPWRNGESLSISLG